MRTGRRGSPQREPRRFTLSDLHGHAHRRDRVVGRGAGQLLVFGVERLLAIGAKPLRGLVPLRGGGLQRLAGGANDRLLSAASEHSGRFGAGSESWHS